MYETSKGHFKIDMPLFNMTYSFLINITNSLNDNWDEFILIHRPSYKWREKLVQFIYGLLNNNKNHLFLPHLRSFLHRSLDYGLSGL